MSAAQPPFVTRTTWRNHLGNQRIDPLRIYSPATIDDVVAIVRLAEQLGVTVRAVGSGHSWSDAALTEGFLIRPEGLARTPAPEPDFVRPEWAQRRLARVEAGARIRAINEHLASRGLGLANMGGYDGQTIAGVISTATHGSGIEFGSFSDVVRSLDVVIAGGEVVRVERADGPTDRARYEAHFGDRRELIQDDHVMDAVSVGIGCMGVIVTAMLEVRDAYFLREVRALRPWSKVRADLEDGGVLRDNAHYELIFSPYSDAGDQTFLVTTRNPIDDPRNRPWDKRMRNWLVEAAAAFPLTPHIINLLLDVRPSLAPRMLEGSMKALVKKSYDEVSYKVYNIGLANYLPAYSAEVGIAVDGRHVEAVERIFAVADEYRRVGAVYQSSPIALRFVKASTAYLSPMHGQDTMMIELIGLTGNDGGYELLHAYEKALYELGGRPHWGQVNTLTGSHGFLEKLYPRYADWQDVHRRMNASGVFDSPFSKRVGLSAPDRFMQ